MKNKLSVELKAKRNELGLTQEDVAILINVSHKTYSEIENGGTLTLIQLTQIAHFLNVDVKEVYEMYVQNIA